jgi:hypothetical protein
MAGALFPKFVIRRSTLSHELRKAKGTSKPINSSAASLFEVPVSNSPLVVQELQMGGTSAANLKFLSVLRQVRLGNFKFKAALETISC